MPSLFDGTPNSLFEAMAAGAFPIVEPAVNVSSIVKNLKRSIRKTLGRAVDRVLQSCAPVLAPMIGRMARTGAGTDACLAWRCLPLPVNWYSPIPDMNDLERRKVWDKRSELKGIDFRADAQVALLSSLGRKFAHECDWPLTAGENPQQFFIENTNFTYGCAASLHSMIRNFKPRRVIEIGSGNSSLIIDSALRLNARDDSSFVTEYNIVDPEPRPVVKRGLPSLKRLLEHQVELLDLAFFEQLGENDILFVDSGHTVRMGSDVNYLILDVLPRLAPGVIIHFHDVPLPYEYAKVYATNAKFRVFWTEAYLLQAFLSFNTHFEIMLALCYLMTERKEIFCGAFPLYDARIHKAISESFWIRRKRS